MKNIKLCYIGGGSKMWARVFMSDLALTDGLSGEVALYDIDTVAAKRNEIIGNRIKDNPKALSKFTYKVYEKLEDALKGSDFVIISILPGTFDEMESDVHAPEEYSIYQSVGDTVGPGGVLRAMRTVPIYEGFAKAIKEYSPNAWVINLTNPMTILTRTLYDVYPGIKAFGCCHEVFHAEQLLCRVLKELKGINVTRKDIEVDVAGINHFTWIDEAYYKDIDILKLLPEFMDKFETDGYYEEGEDIYAFKSDPFAYGNNVKFDLFKRYGILAAAGDRHLAEFCNNTWYLKDPKTVKDYHFNLTTVDYRRNDQKNKIEETILMAEGKKEFPLVKSAEELVDLIKALLGFGDIKSNVNFPNKGQVEGLQEYSIVESNCIFKKNKIIPIKANKLPLGVFNLVNRNSLNIENCYKGIKERNLDIIFESFINQPLCSNLDIKDAKDLFKKMCYNTRKYLDPYFNLDKYFNN